MENDQNNPQVVENTEEIREKTNKALEKLLDPKEMLKKFSVGRVKLTTPIRADGRDVETLEFDFNRVTGREYVAAMDAGGANQNAFHISYAQALSLFATAAGKATNGIDKTDIMERISATDAVNAVKVATYFFNITSRLDREATYDR